MTEVRWEMIDFRFLLYRKMRPMKKNAPRGSHCGDDKGCRRRQEQSDAGKES